MLAPREGWRVPPPGTQQGGRWVWCCAARVRLVEALDAWPAHSRGQRRARGGPCTVPAAVPPRRGLLQRHRGSWELGLCLSSPQLVPEAAPPLRPAAGTDNQSSARVFISHQQLRTPRRARQARSPGPWGWWTEGWGREGFSV